MNIRKLLTTALLTLATLMILPTPGLTADAFPKGCVS